MTAPERAFLIGHLWTSTGWLAPGYLEVDAAGMILRVTGELPEDWISAEIERLDGYVVPGMVNIHSHAHQRGLAGRAEGTSDQGSFWGWRELMYAYVGRLTPDDLAAIAAQAYVEMLEAGYTTVGEFHYLHHDRDGGFYANRAEMSECIIAAAVETGLGLTLLPALYAQGGIGQPPSPGQRRFLHSLDDFLLLVEGLRAQQEVNPLLRVGVAPHSLRAVSAADLATLVEVVQAWSGRVPTPIHIHVAEQQREVAECLAGLGAAPARWLLENMPVDEAWTMIHATHIDAEERRGIAASGAVVGLCPISEANLGDGFFPLAPYHAEGGRWGIATDSNIAIEVTGELRLLEYGQRLVGQRRDIVVTADEVTTRHPGRLLYDRAAAWGAQSLAQPVGALTVGKRADLVELDPDAVALVGHTPDTIMDGWVFGSGKGVVRTVVVGGETVVSEGGHLRSEEIARRFVVHMRALDK